MLAAFYVGYLLTPVVGGWLADQHGGDRVQWLAGLLWSLTTLSIAVLARCCGSQAVLLARFLCGLAQGAGGVAYIL